MYFFLFKNLSGQNIGMFFNKLQQTAQKLTKNCRIYNKLNLKICFFFRSMGTKLQNCGIAFLKHSLSSRKNKEEC